MLGQEGRSPRPVQGGGLVTAGLELVVAASLRVLHAGLGAVRFLLLLMLPSLLPPLPCFALQGLITPLLEAEKCSVFVIVTVFVHVCSHSLVCLCFSMLGKEKTQKHFLLSALQSSCQTREFSPVPLGGGPQWACLWDGWSALKGRVREEGRLWK